MPEMHPGQTSIEKQIPSQSSQSNDHWYDKVLREVYVFGGGTVGGAVNEGIEAVTQHKAETAIKLAHSVGTGILLYSSQFGPAPMRLAGRLAAGYCGIQVYKDMFDANRWNKLGEVAVDTWQSDRNTDRNFHTVQTGLGHFLFDSAVMYAGAKLGSKATEAGISKFHPSVGQLQKTNSELESVTQPKSIPAEVRQATPTEPRTGTDRVTSDSSTSGLVESPTGRVYRFEQQLAAVRVPAILLDTGGNKTIQTVTFDSAGNIGRVHAAGAPSLAAVIRLPSNPSDPLSYGSGMAVRSDGLVVAARHTVRGFANGDIWVRFLNQPMGSFKARILDENLADDLVLLKPLTTLRMPVPYIASTNFADRVATGSQLLSMGVPDVNATLTGHITGNLHLATGKLIERNLCHFRNKPAAEMYRTTVPLDHGMSGGPTFDLSTGKVVGAVIGGEGRTTELTTGRIARGDTDWTTLAPSDKIRQMIVRNWHR